MCENHEEHRRNDLNQRSCLISVRHFFSTAALAILVAACNREGVGSFAPNNSRAAIVSNSDKLYTSNLNAGELVKLSDPIVTAFGVSLSPFGDTVAYVRQAGFGVYTQPATGGASTQIFAPPAIPPQGIVTFIPSGDVLIIFQDGAGKYDLNIVAPTGGTPKVTIPGISQAFVAQAAIKPKRGTNDSEFIFKPYGLAQVPMVLVVGTEMRLYSASASGLAGPTVLAQVVDATMQGLFAFRPVDDVTSGLLSSDGHRLILRTKDGSGHNLFAINLDINSGPVSLVTGASVRPGYSFSPNGHQVVYESGGSLLLYDFDTGANNKLVDSASAPGWR